MLDILVNISDFYIQQDNVEYILCTSIWQTESYGMLENANVCL